MGKAATLYRSIVHAHRKYLPESMRMLGDKYVRAEFHRHKTATQPEQVAQFYREWEKYLEQIQMTSRGSSSGGVGKDLPDGVSLTEDQKVQLARLREEASKAK